MKKSCGIYEITGKGGRKSYKIFADISDLNAFLKKNTDKSCEKMTPLFEVGKYREYQNTEVRKLTAVEIKKIFGGTFMQIEIRTYIGKYLPEMIEIWNEVVEEGIAFPQEELLNETTGANFFREQSYCGVAFDIDRQEVMGLYILHPNNVGRCGHICNASFAVKKAFRGYHIGRKLVEDCLVQGKRCGFRILQFNAVVATNSHARSIYERLGFTQLGTIPKGFRMKDGTYEDICPYYKELR